MFIIGGLGYIVPVVIFWIFGSANIQKWNEIIKKEEDGKNKITTEIVPVNLSAAMGNGSNNNEQTKL